MLDAIRTRRSIRRYTGRPVSKESIETVLRSAMQAPSARNLQPWEFLVVQDGETLKRIPEFHPYSSMVPDASAAILVCGNTRLQEMPGYLAQDCSAAVENLLLEAAGLGLGAVWLGVYPREERMKAMTDLFELPEDILPMALISVGFPAEKPEFQDRYTEDKVHWENW